MPPILTIGLPVFNSERFLRPALRSILAQTLRDWELIAVDDGSTDRSLELLHEIRDVRVKVLHDGRQLGLAARLNQIHSAAQTRYVGRMDADDVSHPERFARQIGFLEQNPEVDIVGSRLASVDRKGTIVGARQLPESGVAADGRPIAPHGTMCMRTEWVRQHPYNDANRLCEDWELFRATRPAIRNLPEVLYFYREFDSFSLRKYIARQWAMTHIAARTDGPSEAGRVGLHALVTTAAYTAAQAIGQQDRLIARRSAPLPASERSRLQTVFDAVVAGAEVQK